MVPASAVSTLKAAGVPDAPATVHPDAIRDNAAYNRAMSDGVHSSASLAASRDHCLVLLGHVDEGKRSDQAIKCIEQEIRMQESIRERDYSDIDDLNHKRQYVIKWGLGLPVFLVMVVFAASVILSCLPLQVDPRIFTAADGLTKALLSFGAGAVVSYYLSSRADKKTKT